MTEEKENPTTRRIYAQLLRLMALLFALALATFIVWLAGWSQWAAGMIAGMCITLPAGIAIGFSLIAYVYIEEPASFEKIFKKLK